MIKKLLCMLAMLLATATAWAAVDVNKADQAALESVKGIGTKMSERILVERKKAPFKDWSDFMVRVKGVSEATATKLSKVGLSVNGASYNAPAATTAAAAKQADNKK